MSNFAVRMWALFFAIIGIGILIYKNQSLGLPLSPQDRAEVYTIQARISFTGRREGAKLDFYIPQTTPGFRLLDEDFISSGFGLALDEVDDNRVAEWAIRQASGQQNLYYRATITPTNNKATWDSVPAFPERPDYPEPFDTAIENILDEVRQESVDVASYTRELLQELNVAEPTNENIKLIREQAGNDQQWINQLIEILKGVRIPARPIWGLTLSDASNDRHLEPLLQVHNGQEWLTYNPRTAVSGIPGNFFVWYVGSNPLLELQGGQNRELIFSISKTYRELLNVARQRSDLTDSVFMNFSLFSLPIQNQNVYRILLMVPLGALIVVLMRVFVGMKTFGTFMPILIALAFRETQLLTGIILFTLIVGIGLMLRFYLERLMLLLVPRLTAILIIVVILMVLISLITNQLGLERSLSIALFPMVILAMTIERMSITWEESGAKTALTQGIGSLVVACIGYLVMTNEQLNYLMFVFPELLFVLLSISLLAGRYTGYRLTELRRFRDVTTEMSKA